MSQISRGINRNHELVNISKRAFVVRILWCPIGILLPNTQNSYKGGRIDYCIGLSSKITSFQCVTVLEACSTYSVL